MTTTKLDAFTLAYIEAALWSSTCDDDTPMDSRYSIDDLAPETLDRIIADCAAFQAANSDSFVYLGSVGRYPVDAHAGHDFWLTRNGHGAGFWDGDWSEPSATQLTDAAHKCGEVYLYAGDDGRLYLC